MNLLPFITSNQYHLRYRKLLSRRVRHKHDRNVKGRKIYFIVTFRGGNLTIESGKSHHIVSFSWEKNCYMVIFPGGKCFIAIFLGGKKASGEKLLYNTCTRAAQKVHCNQYTLIGLELSNFSIFDQKMF